MWSNARDFHQLGPLGQVGLVVAMSVCLFVCFSVPFSCKFFQGLWLNSRCAYIDRKLFVTFKLNFIFFFFSQKSVDIVSFYYAPRPAEQSEAGQGAFLF